ncbi:MAG: RagB/SusD family nutrient uptake outer membrane protein, partial [Prevotella sp.]|nr:RagB/SusD family nutrient uptake outer membrane protein [Prevotella sp.]
TQLMSDNAETLSDQDRDYLEKAFDLVDAVNKRSLMQTELKNTLVLADYGSKTAITNLVYEERNRELMFEGKRFFDLVRRSQRDGNTDYLRSNVSNKSVDIKSTIESKMQKMDAIYWPYNLDEIKANPNLKQNSAFGSGENSSYEKN